MLVLRSMHLTVVMHRGILTLLEAPCRFHLNPEPAAPRSPKAAAEPPREGRESASFQHQKLLSGRTQSCWGLFASASNRRKQANHPQPSREPKHCLSAFHWRHAGRVQPSTHEKHGPKACDSLFYSGPL